MAKHPAVSNYDLSSVRSVGCGAAPLSHDIMKEVEARLDFRVSVKQGWGMTEYAQK
jgi:acyl-coenzyme A synthetase/AMP-(fatty) acid ligase